MKQFFLLTFVCFSALLLAQEQNQNLIMACKPGGYSIEEIRAFALNPVGRLNLNYREDMVDIINTGREECGCDGVLDVRHVNYIMDSSYIEDNVELVDFENSGANGTEILYRTVPRYVGRVVIFRDRSCAQECLIPFIKDTCGNLIKAKLIKPLHQEIPEFARRRKETEPTGSDNVAPTEAPGVTLDTFHPSSGGRVIYETKKKPTQWGEELYNQQQLAKQGVADSLGFISQQGSAGNVININSFNTTYVTPSNAVEENSDGEYTYTRKRRRRVIYSEPQTVMYTPYLRDSYGISFGVRAYGGYGGGYNYYPPQPYYHSGVTGLTSSSAYPDNFNWQGRQVRRGMNGQYEAGSIGSATGPSSGYYTGPRTY
jgi:hypothetical protein